MKMMETVETVEIRRSLCTFEEKTVQESAVVVAVAVAVQQADLG